VPGSGAVMLPQHGWRPRGTWRWVRRPGVHERP